MKSFLGLITWYVSSVLCEGLKHRARNLLEYISQESPIKVDDWLPIRIYIYLRGQFLVVKLYVNNGLTSGVTY